MDDRLRALERAARSNPGDREAAWAFVRALEQSGDARRAWTERCRLARAGDDLAWRELSPAARGARTLEVCATRTLTRGHGEAWNDGTSVFLLDGKTLHTFDARTLEPSWSAASRGTDPGAVWGPYVVHVGSDTATLVVRDRADGAQVAVIQFPSRSDLNRVLSTPGHVVAVWDREDDDRPDELFVMDVPDGAPGAGGVREWPFDHGVIPPITARDVLLQCSPRPSTTVRDLASTQVRWEHEGTPVHADAWSAVLVVRLDRSSRRFVCVDLVTGRLRWEHLVEGATAVSHDLGPDLFVVAKGLTSPTCETREQLEVDALDRETGQVRWSSKELVGAHVIAGVAVAQGVVYLAYGAPWVEADPSRGLGDLTILCLAATTGERIDACPVEGHPERPILRATLSPLDGAVLVTLRGHGGTWLGRVGEP